METQHTFPEFQQLLAGLIAELGGSPEPDEDLQGLEFASGDHVVRVGLHPSQAETLVLEVDVLDVVQAKQDGHGIPWRWLHQYNHDALLDHGWVASLDDETMLVLTLHRLLSSSGVSDLQALMSEGLDQAEALALQLRSDSTKGDDKQNAADIEALHFSDNIIQG